MLVSGVLICIVIEKKGQVEGGASHGKSIETIVIWKRLFIGMLSGFLAFVMAGIAQFVIRFSYFSVLQEIGAIALGFIGAVVGGLISLFIGNRRCFK